MPVSSWNSRLALAVAGCALALAGCAPNTAKTPDMAPVIAGVEKDETSGYATLMRLAGAARTGGDPVAAISIYQQAIDLDSGRSEAHVALADTLVELKEYDEAAQRYDKVLRSDSDNAAAHRGYGRAMLGLNRPEVAITHYQAALALDSSDLAAHNGLGVAFDLAGRQGEAEAAYRQGLEVAPDSVLLRNNLGLSLALDGRQDEAIEVLRSVVEEPGAKARNRQNLALAYGLAGDLVAAEQISRLDLDEDSVQNNLAYFATLAAMEDGRKRAAALGIHAPETQDREADARAPQRLAAIALQGDGLELGVAPAGRWFVDLGEYPSGPQAAAGWRRLRSQHPDVLEGMSRLAGIQDGSQPLLVGPLTDAGSAQALCNDLQSRGQTCRALAL
jgi:Flp pilus assembly protein TadD